MTSKIMFAPGFGVPRYPKVDFNTNTVKIDKKVSHLHEFKQYPDPTGNRAARRAAKKLRKKK